MPALARRDRLHPEIYPLPLTAPPRKFAVSGACHRPRPSPEEVPISEERQVYSEEEFALILRKAAELAEQPTSSGRGPGSLTLGEMKAAAAQAGFDPVLVERAARLLRADAASTPTPLERLIGGKTRHRGAAHLPVNLDEAGAARLLSAVRISAGRTGEGHSGATGVTWRSSDDAGGVLSLTALTDEEGTSLSVELDRRPTLVLGGGLTVVVTFLALGFGGTVVGEVAPGLEIVGGLGGAGAVLALARSLWASSTNTARERVTQIMDASSRMIAQLPAIGSAKSQADAEPLDRELDQAWDHQKPDV